MLWPGLGKSGKERIKSIERAPNFGRRLYGQLKITGGEPSVVKYCPVDTRAMMTKILF